MYDLGLKHTESYGIHKYESKGIYEKIKNEEEK